MEASRQEHSEAQLELFGSRTKLPVPMHILLLSMKGAEKFVRLSLLLPTPTI